jgi:hypothetical protein
MATGGKEGGHHGECKLPVTGKQKGILCEICYTLYHIKCEGVPEDTFKACKVNRAYISIAKDVTKD